jgi:hypothetical protein
MAHQEALPMRPVRPIQSERKRQDQFRRLDSHLKVGGLAGVARSATAY